MRKSPKSEVSMARRKSSKQLILEYFLANLGKTLESRDIQAASGGDRTVRLTMGHIVDKSKVGEDSPQNLRAICTNCNERLQNTSLPKPDQVHLLAQVRRATIDNQKIFTEMAATKVQTKDC
jgi:5-methylcytosine-specific restriction endonuclease McrA